MNEKKFSPQGGDIKKVVWDSSKVNLIKVTKW